MTSDLCARLTDAARTAVETIRRERAGDLRSAVDLVGAWCGTYGTVRHARPGR